MTDKYADMAARVAVRQAARRAKERTAVASAKTRIDSEIEGLEKFVVPILEAAQTSFGSQGLIFELEKYYDVRNREGYVAPSVKFFGKTPVNSKDNYCGDTSYVEFHSSEGTLTIRSNEGHYRSASCDMSKSQIACSEKQIDDAIEWALTVYHQCLYERD